MSRLLITTLLATGLSLPAAQALAGDDHREISGELIYLPRIALPDNASVTVAVEGAFGTILGETRFDTEGAQVPLPFSVDVVPGLSGKLSALIRVEDAAWWIAQDVAVSAGSDPADIGTIQLAKFTPLAFATEFECNGTEVLFGVADDKSVLRVGERDFEMVSAISASGARYVAADDESTEFWSRGDSAMLTVEGQDMGNCTQVAPDATDYRAYGNEPGWSAIIGEDTVALDADYGAVRFETDRPEAQLTPGAYVFDMPEISARLTLEDRLCNDLSTGMPHPHHATLRLEERELRGCGGDPASLLTGAEWTITDIDGTPPIDGTETVIGFGPDARSYGSTGCNRFMGGYTLTGEGFSLEPLGVTMMACPDPLMDQERAVLDALEAVRRFDFDESGALLLIGGPEDAPVLTARRD